MKPVMGNCDIGLAASSIAPGEGSGKPSALEVKPQEDCGSNKNCLETMFPEETDPEINVYANNLRHSLQQKLCMVAPVQWENAPARHGVETSGGNYWGTALSGLLRIMKQAKFRDKQT